MSRIDQIDVGRANAAHGMRASEAKAAASSPAPVETGGRNVPRLITLANELAAAGPPVDYAKVAQLRAAIADGRYQVDVAAIARAMQQTMSVRD